MPTSFMLSTFVQILMLSKVLFFFKIQFWSSWPGSRIVGNSKPPPQKKLFVNLKGCENAIVFYLIIRDTHLILLMFIHSFIHSLIRLLRYLHVTVPAETIAFSLERATVC